ncbi:MAG: SDR family oxidoreductase [Clostridia bacterium]|nr:SDR family oxidoreductase [Clostridia bacterium]
MKALITGASSGIGREIAKYLSSIGWETVLVARREERLKSLASELDCSAFEVCDLTSEEECDRLFKKYSDIDLLVNSAGCGVFGEFCKTDLERERQMLSLNIIALHMLTKLYAKAFVKRGTGRILNVSSSAGFFSGPLFSSYYASKAYVLHLSEAISYELRKSGVTASVFCPGPVKTEFGLADGISHGIGAISPELAARKAVDGVLKGKRIIYPNLQTRMLVFASRFIPREALLKIVAKQQAKKAGRSCQN